MTEGGIICYCGQAVATYHQECMSLHDAAEKGGLCGETVCAAYRDQLECKIHKLEKDLKDAREFAERAAKLYNDSLVLRCAFCGQAYKDGTPDTRHEELTKHISVCPEHPMRKLEAENEALKSNISYPWCPECKVECHATDEDHCCSSCGVDVVWPTAQHVENLGKVVEVLKKLKAVAPTTCEVEGVLEEVDAVLSGLEVHE